MRRVLGALMALVALIGGCYGTPEDPAEQEIGVTEQEVQTDYLSIIPKRYIEAVSGNSINATASIHLKWPNLNPPAGSGSGAATCGATFVSKHYAITAAHCVDAKGPLDNDPLITPMVDKIELRQYNTTNLNWWTALNTSIVSGNWPNWTRGTTLTSNDGYVVTSYTDCVVKLRCGVAPTSKCPAGINGDIALVYCPSRTSTTWSAVSDTEAAANQQIEILWFHELLALTSNGNAGDQYWDHYGNKVDPDGNGPMNEWQNNWHYRTLHQLLPFRSTSWDDSTPYKVVAAPANGSTVTWTDAFGCHGTSGSGIFKAGTTWLLGPTVNPGAAFFTDGQDLLCADMDNPSVGPGQAIASYTRQSITRQIEQINIPNEGTVVLNDR